MKGQVRVLGVIKPSLSSQLSHKNLPCLLSILKITNAFVICSYFKYVQINRCKKLSVPVTNTIKNASSFKAIINEISIILVYLFSYKTYIF